MAGQNAEGRRRSRRMAIIAFIIGIALAIFGLVLRHVTLENAAHLTATSTATIQAGAEEDSTQDCNSNGRTCSTDYTCSFTYTFVPESTTGAVKGEGQDPDQCGDEQAEGAQRTVYYDPGHPADNSVEDPKGWGNTFDWAYPLIIAAASFLYGIWELAASRRSAMQQGEQPPQSAYPQSNYPRPDYPRPNYPQPDYPESGYSEPDSAYRNPDGEYPGPGSDRQ